MAKHTTILTQMLQVSFTTEDLVSNLNIPNRDFRVFVRFVH